MAVAGGPAGSRTGGRIDAAALTLEGALLRLRLLAEVAGLLAPGSGGALTPAADAPTRLARLVVPELADWCTVTLVQTGRLRQTQGWAHRSPATEPLLAQYAAVQAASMSERAAVALVLRTGEEVLTPVMPPLADWVGPASSQELLERLAPSSVSVLPLSSAGRTLGAIALVRTGGPALAGAQLETAREVARRAGLVLDNVRLQARTALLSEITHRLADTLEPAQVVTRLAELVVPTLGDWAVAGLVQGDEPGELTLVGDLVGVHSDPARQGRLDALTLARSRAGAGTALAAVSPDPDHVTVAPLRTRGRTVGVLEIYTGRRRGPLDDQDLESVAEIASRAALALDNARLYRRQRDLAEHLQRAMLTEPRRWDDLQMAVRYRPASETARVGGDWYDAFRQPGGATTVVIGDVVGHDTAAAAAMGQVRTILRALGALDDDAPALVLSNTDDVLQTLGVEITATTVVARLLPLPAGQPAGWQLLWSNAGHPPPVVLAGPHIRLLGADVESDLLLGVEPGTERHTASEVLRPGDTLLLYTDGLIERRDQSLTEGLAELQGTLHELQQTEPGLDELLDALLDRLLPDRPEDDVALLAVRIPEPGSLRSAGGG